ncbi:MAG: diaminopimelate decarboxylase [Bacteroidetes bacterium]|nr:diaminopimelate decarboxylase [Bacteroidota bacterium]
MENLSPGKISSAFKRALQAGLIREEDTAVIFYDLTFLKERLSYLSSCFPSTTLHGLAVKACPLSGVMQLTKELGFGVEAASMGEVKLALHQGFDPGMIVYDSPVKTREELEFALDEGIHLNLDNFSELERVNILLKNRESKSTIGIRINPQIGEGSIKESSVAGEYSKFGVPLRFKKQELTNAFLENDFLSGMHLHVGSQGCPLEMLVEGTGELYDLMLEINRLTSARKGYVQITTFDIGGGLPVSYSLGRQPVSMEAYVAALKQRAPLLFREGNLSLPGDTDSGSRFPDQGSRIKDQGVRLITEFGRWTYTNPGWTVSRVEYVKHDPGVSTAMLHVGADLFVRECLNPRDWLHEYTVLDGEGNPRTGNSVNPWNLAGPLCFSGDILAKGVSLPEVREGDHIVIHDTGGYTFSMWSRYNSRFAPRIIGYYNEGESFVLLKEREEMEDIIRFWT